MAAVLIAKHALQTHLCSHVLVTWRADKRETYEKNVRLRIRERAETVVILLTGGIPETERDCLVVNHDGGGVIVED